MKKVPGEPRGLSLAENSAALNSAVTERDAGLLEDRELGGVAGFVFGEEARTCLGVRHDHAEVDDGGDDHERDDLGDEVADVNVAGSPVAETDAAAADL